MTPLTLPSPLVPPQAREQVAALAQPLDKAEAAEKHPPDKVTLALTLTLTLALTLALTLTLTPSPTATATPNPNPNFFFRELVDEWGRGFVAETDYRYEAANTAAFSEAMGRRGLGAVTAPTVVGELSTNW